MLSAFGAPNLEDFCFQYRLPERIKAHVVCLFVVIVVLSKIFCESKSEMYVNLFESVEVEEAAVWLGRI